MREPLSEEEENLIKDILSELDSGHPIVHVLANQRTVSPMVIMERLDTIWAKLNNGRVTLVQDKAIA